MARSTVFKSNRSQAVRLPKDVAFPDGTRQVAIIKIGSARLITPIAQGWDDFFDNAPALSDDFMVAREDRPPEERQPL